MLFFIHDNESVVFCFLQFCVQKMRKVVIQNGWFSSREKNCISPEKIALYTCIIFEIIQLGPNYKNHVLQGATISCIMIAESKNIETKRSNFKKKLCIMMASIRQVMSKSHSETETQSTTCYTRFVFPLWRGFSTFFSLIIF